MSRALSYQRVAAAALGAVFVFAGFSKTFDPQSTFESVESIVGFNISEGALFLIVAGLSLVEIVLGLLAIGWIWPKRSAILLALVIVGLTAVMLKLVLDPSAPPCGCLGRVSPGMLPEEIQKANQLGLARNVAMLMVSVWIVKCSFVKPSAGDKASFVGDEHQDLG